MPHSISLDGFPAARDPDRSSRLRLVRPAPPGRPPRTSGYACRFCGPRLLLRRLREVMAEPVSAQARLDKIVVLIASNMVAEVCSLYLRRVDATLELFATEGLNPEAVHHTLKRPTRAWSA